MKQEHLIYMAGHLSLVGVTFIFNLLAARLLGPEQMGIWQSANLISIYGFIVTFGVLNGMAREIPVRIGEGDSNAVAEMVATALIFLLILVVTFVLAGVVALEVASESGLVIGIGLILLSAKMFNMFSIMLIRSHQTFYRLGLHQGISALALSAGMVAIWIKPSIVTLLVTMTVSLVLCSVLSVKFIHFKPVSFHALRKMSGIGTPIMFAGLLFGLLTTVDRVLILNLLDTKSLGLYSPVISVSGALIIAPYLVSNVMYPRMGQMFGKTHSHVDLMPLVAKMIRLNYLSTMPIAIMLGLGFYYVVVPYFLPGYEDSRVPLAFALLSALFLPLGQSMGDFFTVIGWQRLYLRNMAIGMAVNCMAGYFLTAHSGLGLSGVALGSVAGMAAYVLCQWMTYRRLLVST